MQVNPEDNAPDIYVTWSYPRMTDFENRSDEFRQHLGGGGGCPVWGGGGDGTLWVYKHRVGGELAVMQYLLDQADVHCDVNIDVLRPTEEIRKLQNAPFF